MRVNAIKKKLQKYREESSKLNATAYDRNKDKEIEELNEKLKNSEQIIKRFNSTYYNNNINEDITNSYKAIIENDKKNLVRISKKCEVLEESLSKAKKAFDRAKSEDFKNEKTILALNWALSKNSNDCIKRDPYEISSILPKKSKACEISIKPDPAHENNIIQEHEVPFIDYLKPISAKNNMMNFLNKYIDKFLKCSSTSERSNYSDLITQYFNKAQTSVFLYPKTAQYVSVDESMNRLEETEEYSFTDAQVYSEGSNKKPLVVIADWPEIISVYKNRRLSLPEFLMLIAREKSDYGMKYVLFVLNAENSSVLRYDPLCEKMTNKNYRRVYSNVFSQPKEYHRWQKRHLDEDKNGISWLYCIEFARRFAMKAEEEMNLGWIFENVMKGFHGDTRPFASIDFELKY